LEFQGEILPTYLVILHAHNSLSYQHPVSFQCFKVISIIAMPPSDFGVLENVRAITQQITPLTLK